MEEQTSPVVDKRSAENGMSRRDFIKGAAGIAAGTMIPGANELANFAVDADKMANSKQETEHPKTTERLVVVDYFSDETNEATRQRLIEDVQASVTELAALDFSEIQNDEVAVQLALYKETGTIGPVAGLMVDKVIEQGDHHGLFVEENYRTNSGNKDDVRRIGVQNAARDYSLDVDQLGNIEVSIAIDPEELIAIYEQEEIPLEGVMIGAFQFGSLEGSYTLYDIKPQPVDYTEANGEVFMVWGDELEGSYNLAATTIDGQIIPTVNGEPATNYQKSEIVAGDWKAIDEEIERRQNELKEELRIEIEEGNLTGEELQEHISLVNEDKRMAFSEPYNAPENIRYYKDFCAMAPNMFVVQPGGNFSDLRGHNEELPVNGILASGAGGELRKRAFGTEGKRQMGAVGAEVYVSFADIHPETIGVMTSSEATAVVGAYAEKLDKLGIPTNEIKTRLLENCSDLYQAEDREFLLQVADDEYIEGYVFNKEKADAYIASLN